MIPPALPRAGEPEPVPGAEPGARAWAGDAGGGKGVVQGAGAGPLQGG